MSKKITALMLCILLAIGWTPRTRAASEADLRQSIQAQVEAYAGTVYRKNAADDTVDVMLKQALYGNGKTLHFSQKDAVTAALYESQLLRTCLIENLCVAVPVMLESQTDAVLFGTDALGWHDFALEYRVSQYQYNDTSETKDDVVNLRHVPQTIYEGATNKCDSAMLLVVGYASIRIRMHLLEKDFTTASYRVDICVSDEFEFGGDYSAAEKMGFDTTFSKLVSALGPLLGMDEFTWDSTSSFEITVPLYYRCEHRAQNYRWEHNGTDFVAVQGEGLTSVAANRVDFNNSDGSFHHYYQLESSILLRHDLPWVLEFRRKGNQGFMLASGTFLNTEEPYFLCTNYMHVGYYDSSSDRKGRHQYGFDVTALGFSSGEMHTFRMENRIAPDGSNMVWLLVDGQELGPMTHYYYNPTYVNQDMETEDDWVSGQDFSISYIGGGQFPIKGEFEYLAIWEMGDGESQDPFLFGHIQPTCVTPGYATRTCLFCGYTETTENAPSLGHRETSLPGTAPTCIQAGITEGKQCEICSEILIAQEPLPALGHSVSVLPAISATCTETGLTEEEVCSTCHQILKARETVPMVEHRYEKGRCIACSHRDPDFLIGDADFDGALSYRDALLILRTSIGLESCDTELCDTDGNGLLNYQDALTVLRASIGL